MLRFGNERVFQSLTINSVCASANKILVVTFILHVLLHREENKIQSKSRSFWQPAAWTVSLAGKQQKEHGAPYFAGRRIEHPVNRPPCSSPPPLYIPQKPGAFPLRPTFYFPISPTTDPCFIPRERNRSFSPRVLPNNLICEFWRTKQPAMIHSL